MADKQYYLCVTPFFPSEGNWRGAYVFDQVKAIERHSDYKVLVFIPCGLFEKPSSFTIGGISVYRIPCLQMPSYFFNGMSGGLNGRSLIRQLKTLHINPNDIAVCHCHTAGFACFATAIKKFNPLVKTVLQYHDLDPYQIHCGKFATWYPNVTYRVNKFVSHFKNIDLHLCISERTRYNLLHFPAPHPEESYAPYLAALNSARHLKVPRNLTTYVLYNGVDTNVFHKIASLTEQQVFKIGCIANFNDLKDHMTLIKAVELLVKSEPELKLIVSFVGSGSTLASCRDYISQKQLNRYFEFVSEMSHESLPEYFNTLNLFVLPSYFEGFGCVYTEAAACGVPFIGCVNQGYSEYIPDDDRDKWLIKPHDYKTLSLLIDRQIKSPVAQTLKYTYDINILVKSYLNYLADLNNSKDLSCHDNFRN